MWTPLHFAAQRGYNRICKLLMESGSPITAVTKVLYYFFNFYYFFFI